MTKRLILMRHAESGWNGSEVDDHDRCLTQQGVSDARAGGAWLAKKVYLPDVALVSTSRRTRETLAAAQDNMADCAVDFLPELYLGSPGRLLSVLQQRSENTVMMIAHNPGIAALAAGLLAGRFPHPQFRTYPSGAISVIDFDLTSWVDIQPASGLATDFVIPSEF